MVLNCYTFSTKDTTRHGRSSKVSQFVKIQDENRYTSDRTNFSLIYTNKQQ